MSEKIKQKMAVLLAAGDGKRMKSDRPKVLCEVLFKPMICWVEQACRAADIKDIVIVAGAGADLVEKAVSPVCSFVLQNERRGTGHAVMMAQEAIQNAGDVLVLSGDAPFITPQVIREAYACHTARKNAVTVVSARLGDPAGYGRIVRDTTGVVQGIVEQKDLKPGKQTINEVNAGAYWFDAAFLSQALGRLTTDNAQGEYYLTDTVAIALKQGLRADAFDCGDETVVLGANDRRALAQLNQIARRRVIDRHLDSGVDIPFEDGVIIDADVVIEHDAQILPGTVLRGKTTIGAHSVIGPDSNIVDSSVGAGSVIRASYLTESTVGEHTTIGPFCQLRPDSHIGDHVKIGDFVEVKNSTIGNQTSIAHLTYIGDSDVGRLCNFGCGVVTANYDGVKKYRTVIEDRAFVGCNTNLIPPVHIGKGAYTAAGTTIDSDVPDGALAIGRARQEIKPGWADEHIRFKAE